MLGKRRPTGMGAKRFVPGRLFLPKRFVQPGPGAVMIKKCKFDGRAGVNSVLSPGEPRPGPGQRKPKGKSRWSDK